MRMRYKVWMARGEGNKGSHCGARGSGEVAVSPKVLRRRYRIGQRVYGRSRMK